MATTIALIRHGEVENPDKLYYGRLPGFGLSQLGQRQAAAARDYLQHQSPAAIFSSPSPAPNKRPPSSARRTLACPFSFRRC